MVRYCSSFNPGLNCAVADPRPEVTQQSKARHKDDFLNAFSPFIADATAVAYKGAPADVQGKLRRVVEVWKERSIFDRDILQDLENKLAGKSFNVRDRASRVFLMPTFLEQKSIRHAREPTLVVSAAMHSVPQGHRSRQSSLPWLRRSRLSPRPFHP